MNDDFHEHFNRYLHDFRSAGGGGLSPDLIDLPEFMGQGTITRTKLRPGMELIVANCRLNDDRTIRFHSETPMIELSFWLDGSIKCSLGGERQAAGLPQSRLLFARRMRSETRYKGGQTIETCGIRLSESAFASLIGSLGGDAPLNWKRLLAEREMSARVFCQAIDPAEQLHIRRLLACPYVPALRNMYLEGTVLELLAGYLQRYLFDDREACRKDAKKLGRTVAASIRSAADTLVRRMDDPPSLPELARLVQLSEFKLKVGFKELYGTTVFGYLRERRMERALQLLEQEKISIYEASLMTGYSNPSHFAAVFRDKFGLNPSRWRRDKS